MSDGGELRARLEGLQDSGERTRAVLSWAQEHLRLSGAAIMEADPASARGVAVTLALGSLAGEAAHLAERLAGAGLPRTPGLMALPAGPGGIDAVYCLPLEVPAGSPWAALVLHGDEAEEAARIRARDLKAASVVLKEEVARQRASRRGGRGDALPALLAGLGAARDATRDAATDAMAAAEGLAAGGLSVLVDDLHLPLYACDGRGRFLYASPGFLALTGYRSLEELAARDGFFCEPGAAREELERARLSGKVDGVPLAVLSGAGTRLQVHDTAVCLSGTYLGVFFDVTGLMAANAELKDSLQVQELLNDSIIAGTKILQRTQEASIRSLARLAEYRDQETGYHLQRICELTRLLAEQVFLRAPYSFRVTREYADDISISSMLHDIGKVSIPDSILLKAGKLEPPEWDMMKKHTKFGWEVLHKADRELGEQSFLTLAATIALCHHERYDGTGYPDGRSGSEIPLSARIASIADVYDALTSERPYKKAWEHGAACAEIVAQSGRQFDPILVEIFKDLQASFDDVRRQFAG